jgi:hypothetical protein
VIAEIQELIDRYIHWLKEKTALRDVDGEWVEITTPYLDRHNDYLQIYARKDNGGFLLTDDSYTISDLEQSGCDINTPKRERLLEVTLNGFGVKRDVNALQISAAPDNFSLRKHSLIQAMLAVNDLFYLSRTHVSSLFLEDVESWLDLHDIRYSPKISFTGKTGFTHQFDFLIPKSKTMPERIVKAINSPSRQTVQNLAFTWVDTKEARPSPDARAIAFLNDSEKPVPGEILDALKRYQVTPVPWSEKENIREQLVA